MGDNTELLANIESYNAQLKQVEAALMIDEDNEELKTLKTDLEEVIALTTDLLGVKEPVEPPPIEEDKDDTSANDLIATELGTSSSTTNDELYCQWKQGDSCQAAWSKDGRYYDAIVMNFTEDPTTCAVKFDKYDQVETVTISSLKSRDADSRKRGAADSESGKQPKLSKDEMEKRREQRKKKLLRKRQRLKDIEEQREKEKGNWQAFFNGKGKGKSKIKGLNKKSIFATPDSSSGKVGIGTCGIGGKGMTKYESPAQYIYKK